MENKSKLKQCTIILTRNCNLRCNFCFEKKAGYCLDDTISYEEFKKIVDFCCDAKVQYIFLTGGEPLLYPHLIDALQYIKSKEFLTPTIATNGILLKDLTFCNQLVDCGLAYIDISLKGGSAQEWKCVTGYDGEREQLEAIRNLASLPVEFTCSMVITSENVLTFCDAVQTAYNNGAKQFSFTFFIDNNDSEEKELNYLNNNNPFALIDCFLSQINRLNSITDEWWIEYSFPMCIYTEDQLRLLEGRLAGPCQIHLKNAVTFTSKMELLPCDMYVEQKIGKLGEDFTTFQEFENLRERSMYQNIIAPLQKLPSKKCSNCQYLDACYGGCPVLWKNYSFEALTSFKSHIHIV